MILFFNLALTSGDSLTPRLILSAASDAFKASGDGGFKEMYCRFLIIAAVYVGLALIGIGGLIGLAVMAFTYKVIFDAGWLQAFVIGLLGGILGWILFFLTVLSLAMMGVPLGQ